MQYTEEHYAQMYNDLPEGLKDLILSGRLAILVSAIGSRHGLNADQVADLEPAIEDVCLGLITKEELVDNILKNVSIDQRVANRIAGEAMLEILQPFEGELVIARKQKEDLDEKINKESGITKPKPVVQNSVKNNSTQNNSQASSEPKDVSDHGQTEKISQWYNKNENSPAGNASKKNDGKVSFDWDKDFGAKTKKEETVETPQNTTTNIAPTLESKLDVLTESINKLVDSRFGSSEKKDSGISEQMQELIKRLEKAEKENEENKKLIRTLQTGGATKPLDSIFGNPAAATNSPTQNVDDKQNKIQIDKERKVDIAHAAPKTEDKQTSGNIQINSVSKAIPIEKPATKVSEIISSAVSKDTLDSIVETRNKVTPSVASSLATNTSAKKVLSLDELMTKGDNKIKEATNKTPTTGTLVFPGLNDEKKIDIKNMSQKDSLRDTLISDLAFLEKGPEKDPAENTPTKNDTPTDTQPGNPTTSPQNSDSPSSQEGESTNTVTQNTSSTTNLFKEELLPKTKEERMKALQDKIKALNKGVSVGGKTNITASGLDPYRL
jgi:hypothetical protein